VRSSGSRPGRRCLRTNHAPSRQPSAARPGGPRLGSCAPAVLGRATTGRHGVRIHRHSASQRHSVSAGDGRAGVQRDARVGDNSSIKRSSCTESRRAAHLPIHVVVGTGIDNKNGRGAGGRERAPDLENDVLIGKALEVECKLSRQLRRGVVCIDVRYQRLSTQALAGQVAIRCQARQIVVGCQGIGLSPHRNGVRVVYRSAQAPRREPRNRRAGIETQISGDDGRSGVGHRRGTQDPKGGRCSQGNRAGVRYAANRQKAKQERGPLNRSHGGFSLFRVHGASKRRRGNATAENPHRKIRYTWPERTGADSTQILCTPVTNAPGAPLVTFAAPRPRRLWNISFTPRVRAARHSG